MTEPTVYDWNELAFGSKKPLRSLGATFIMAPREMTAKRLTNIVKTYLAKGHVIIGIAKEPYVTGFEGQPQFRMLDIAPAQKLADKVAAAGSPHRLVVLRYFQRDLVHFVGNLDISRFVAVNGSYKLAFHNLPVFYHLASANIPIDHVSPFDSEDEAKEYARTHMPELQLPAVGEKLDDHAALSLAIEVAKQSYDYSTQVGAVLVKKSGKSYKFLAAAYNRVIPHQGYALHYGSQREIHLSPPSDVNHYDTIHAEMAVLIEAARQNISLSGATLFTDLMPCPACARVLSGTDIEEFVYQHDYGDGYAVKLFELSGKTVRRFVPKEAL